MSARHELEDSTGCRVGVHVAGARVAVTFGQLGIVLERGRVFVHVLSDEAVRGSFRRNGYAHKAKAAHATP